jgi:pyruvate/2-oxoacid:ferredoxin oxidoreductase alpha subunit
MGNCVTSAYFQGFKTGQKQRLQAALQVLPQVAQLFQERFGRRGIETFEQFGMDDGPEVALVCTGPDAGTATHLLPQLRREMRARVGIVVLRLLTPFPSEELERALQGVAAIGVVNNAFHHGRGHLTLDVRDAVADAVPIASFFCGLGGADVSPTTWRAIARETCETAARGAPSRRWHLLHDGVELEEG